MKTQSKEQLGNLEAALQASNVKLTAIADAWAAKMQARAGRKAEGEPAPLQVAV